MSLLDSDAELSPTLSQEYEKLLLRGRVEDFSNFEKVDLIRVIGKDAEQRTVLLFVPCFLGTGELNSEKALRYALVLLENYVRDHYSVIMCQTRTNLLGEGSFDYFRQYYSILPRSYRKNLKKIYILHSGVGTKTLLSCMTPFIAQNFWKKIEYIDSLEDLIRKLKLPPLETLRFFPYVVQREDEVLKQREAVSFFGCDLECLSLRFGRRWNKYSLLPSLLIKIFDYLLQPENLALKDLFNLQTSASNLYAIVGDIENGDPTLEFDDASVAVTIFRLFLDSQPIPVFGANSYEALKALCQAGNSVPADLELIKLMQQLVTALPRHHKDCLKALVTFFGIVEKKSSENQMTFPRIAAIFASSFFRTKSFDSQGYRLFKVANKAVSLFLEKPGLVFQENLDASDSENSSDDSETSAPNVQDNHSPLSKNSESTQASENMFYSTGDLKLPKGVPMPVKHGVPATKSSEEEEEEEEEDEEEEDEDDESEED